MPGPLDHALLSALQRLAGGSADRFYSALFLSDQPGWVLAAAGMVAIWTGDRPAAGAREPSRGKLRAALVFCSLALAFVGARVAAHFITRDRPMADPSFAVPIPMGIWNDIRSGIRMQGAFPSDHAAMFGVLVVGLFGLGRAAGLLGVAGALFFSGVRVATGFHWPSDILGGAVIGVSCALLALSARPLLARFLEPPLAWVERHPVVSYPVLFLVALDFSDKFGTLFGVLGALFGRWVAH